MRYNELSEKWTQRYRERGLFDVLSDFEKAGGRYAGGTFGTVFIHPRWSFVYKIFVDDSYLRFVRWAMRNPHPCLPRFLTKPKWVIPFFHRHKKAAEVCVVKMEKLNEWKYPPELKEMGGFSYVLEHVAFSKGEYDGDAPGPRTGDLPIHLERWKKTKDLLNRHPEFKQLCDFYPILNDAPVPDAPDIHVGNVMQRDDGTLVFTDPFWHGETPYSLAAAQRQAEMDYDYEDDEGDYVKGGERYRPKPKPKPRSYRPSSNDTDDIPF